MLSELFEGRSSADTVEGVAEVDFQQDLSGPSIAQAPLPDGVDGNFSAQGRAATNLERPEVVPGILLT